MKNFNKFILASTLLIGFASNNSFAACPAVTPNSPPYPAITKLEFENPKAVSKPWVGFTNTNSDIAQVTGGSLTNGKLIFLITFDRAIEAGCELKFDVYDDSLTSFRDRRNSSDPFIFKRQAGKIVPVSQISRKSDIANVISNGTNKVRVPVTISPVRGITAETHTLKLVLDSTLINHPVMPVTRFRFQNNPLKITNFTQISNTENRSDNTRIGEFITTLNEPIDPSISLYDNITGIDERTPSGVFIKYTANPTNAGNFLSGGNNIRMPYIIKNFDTNFADRADHVSYKTNLFSGPQITVQLVSTNNPNTFRSVGPEKSIVFNIR